MSCAKPACQYQPEINRFEAAAFICHESTHAATASLSMRFMFPPTKNEQQSQSRAAICEMNRTFLEHVSLLLCCGAMRVVQK